MSKFQPYSRRVLHSLFRTWAARHVATICKMAAIAAVLLIFETAAIIIFWQLPGRGYVLGAMHTFVCAVFIFMLAGMFLAHNRAAIGQLRGAWGEDATRTELKEAKRKKLIWGSIDSVNLGAGDLDHLVVTRHGGLVVIDSKWRTEAVTDPTEMARSAARVKTRAEALTRTLLSRDYTSRHRASTNPVSVLPAVVLWGPSQQELPTNAQNAGIDFIAGNRLISWLGQLEGNPVDKPAAKDLLRRLSEFRTSAWDAKLTAKN